MKKFVLLICTLICAIPCISAQDLAVEEISIEAQDLNSVPKKIVYAELLGWNNNILGLKGKLTVEVDFGDESWGWSGNDGRNVLVDEDGKKIKFESMVDAMNFMGKRGWKFEAAYVVTVSQQNVIHWLMSKEINIDEDAHDGILQKRDFKKKKKGKESNSKQFDDIYL